jgi:hypothetical protein
MEPTNIKIKVPYIIEIPLYGTKDPGGPGPPHYRRFRVTHNNTSQSVGLLWTSEQPKTKTFDKTQHSYGTTSMFLAGIKPAIPATKRPQTHAIDSAATCFGHD